MLIRGILKFILPLIGSLLMIQPAFAAGFSCSELFPPDTTLALTFKQKVIQYSTEVRDTLGARILFRAQNNKTPIISHHFFHRVDPNLPSPGLRNYLRSMTQTPSRLLARAMTGRQDLRLTPLSGLYHVGIRQPVVVASRYLTGREYEPSGFFKFTSVLATTVFISMQLTTAYDSALLHEIDVNIAEYSQSLDQEILEDFRFRNIKQQLSSGRVDIEAARKEAYYLHIAYNQYYSYRDHYIKPVNLQDELSLLPHILFSHLTSVIENGVQPAEGYLIPEENLGALTDVQKLALFQNTHELYFKYQLIDALLGGSDLIEALSRDSLTAPVLQEVTESAVYQRIQIGLAAGALTLEQARYFLQEDAFWVSRFKDWDVLGVTRLSRDDANKYTNEPLTIEIIQNEILSEVAVLVRP